jgi:hypothetical protein
MGFGAAGVWRRDRKSLRTMPGGSQKNALSDRSNKLFHASPAMEIGRTIKAGGLATPKLAVAILRRVA